MIYTDKIRLLLIKNQIEENNLTYLKDLSDDELIRLLDLMVIPNSVDINAIKQTNLFHFVFMEKQERKEKLIYDINKLINFAFNLTKTEKMIIKFGLVKGFKTSNAKSEFYRYLKEPLSLKSISDGRKFMAFRNFKEIFYFIYNLVTRGKSNDRLPKI